VDAQYDKPTRMGSFEDAFETAANGLADSISTGLSQAALEVIADPIVRSLMAADGVDEDCLKALLRSVASKLAAREPAPECCGSW
jgi:hypothetical protein